MAKLLALAIAGVQAAECGTASTLREVTDSYFPETVRMDFVDHNTAVDKDHFAIYYGSNFKVVNNNFAKQQYVLTQCGTTAPDAAAVTALAALPEGFTQKDFTIPLQSWSSDSTASLAFLDILGVHDRHHFVSDSTNAPCLKKALDCDATLKAEAGGAWGNETLKGLQKDVADGYFIDTADDHAKTIAMTVAHDPSVMNQAEWIKFIGAFFNKEDVAQEHIDSVTAKWSTLTDEGAAGANAGKLVAIIEHDTFAAGGAMKINIDPWKTMLVAAAGGTSLTTETLEQSSHAVVADSIALNGGLKVSYNASVPAAVDAFNAAIANAALIVDETYRSHTPGAEARTAEAAAIEASFGTLPAPVYREDKLLSPSSWGYGSDWFEGRFARPDVALQDFLAALHGTDAARTYLRLPSEEAVVVTKNDCATDMPICGDATFAPIDTLYERFANLDTATDSGAAAAMVALVLLLQ
jgi:hypothetical protein